MPTKSGDKIELPKTTHRSLIWTTAAPTPRALERAGFEVIPFGDLRAQFIEPARRVTSSRTGLGNAAQGLLERLDQSRSIAVLGAPTATSGDIGDIYSFLVEPAFRRDLTLLIEADRDLSELEGAELVTPDIGYEWHLQRLQYIGDRFLRLERSDGLPPLTPIEAMLLDAMRERELTPDVQYGIGKYRADFAFPDQRLIVEADGRAWHDAERDALRDEFLRTKGWETVRFTGSEIFRNVSRVVDQIEGALSARSEIVTFTEVPVPQRPRSWWRRFLDWLFGRRQEEQRFEEIEQTIVRSVPEWKAHLDENQRQAVDAHEGVVQVIAPAGSGKTTTMITRVQELISRGTPSNRILCTTFNRASRDELDERLKGLGVPTAEVRSFHSLGRFILAEEGLLRSDIGTVSYGLWRRLAKQAMDSIPDGVWLDAPVASELVSNYKLAHMWDPDTAMKRARTETERTAATIYQMYEDHLRSADKHDFDDLILAAVRLLQEQPAVRENWQDRWEAVLVDEYQDIEPAQELLIRMVAAPQDSLFAVGDEDQCIYSWRRASVERIVMLDTVYPGLERVVLTTSYRCPAVIVEAAQKLIANNVRRFPKQIRPNPGNARPGTIEVLTTSGLTEGAEAVGELLHSHVESPQDVVVLARTTRLLREVVHACMERGIPVRAPARALRLTDAEDTVLAYLRLASSPTAADPADVKQSFRVPNRYLPAGAETGLASGLQGGRSFSQAVAGLPISEQEQWRRRGVDEWAELLERLSSSPNAVEAIKHLRLGGGLDRHYSSLEQMTPHDQVEVESLEDLEQRASGQSLAAFATSLQSKGEAISGLEDERGIELSTIHGAKGREWNTVILFGTDADQMPHFRGVEEAETDEEKARVIEDERRLAYVAMTRTKSDLVVVCTSQPSPFLREAGLSPSVPDVESVHSSRDRRRTNAEDHNVRQQAARNSSLQARPTSAATTTAKYPGSCSECNGQIRPGQPIAKSGNRWVHEPCAAN